jgi:chromosome segregation ATPase
MVKLTNPFYYPIAILAGGIVLVAGVRVFKMPNLVILPTSALIATATAMFLKSREPDPEKLALKAVERELINLKTAGQSLAIKAEGVRQEASQLLGRESDYLELLVSVQEVCDSITELPHKIEEFGKRLPRDNSVLSLVELETELGSAQQLLASSSGIARQQAAELVKSLERNIELAKTGKSVHQARLLSLQKMIQDSAGILQELQNKIRLVNRQDTNTIEEIETLSKRLKSVQDNLGILIH